MAAVKAVRQAFETISLPSVIDLVPGGIDKGTYRTLHRHIATASWDGTIIGVGPLRAGLKAKLRCRSARASHASLHVEDQSGGACACSSCEAEGGGAIPCESCPSLACTLCECAAVYLAQHAPAATLRPVSPSCRKAWTTRSWRLWCPSSMWSSRYAVDRLKSNIQKQLVRFRSSTPWSYCCSCGRHHQSASSASTPASISQVVRGGMSWNSGIILPKLGAQWIDAIH